MSESTDLAPAGSQTRTRQSLYEIVSELQHLLEADELAPGTEERLDQLGLTLNAKVDGICRVMAELDGEAAAYKHEIDRLSHSMQSRVKAKERLKAYLKTSLETIGETKVKTPLFSLSICKNSVPSVDIEPELVADLPEEFQRLRIEANKSAIAAALERRPRTSRIRQRDGRDSPAHQMRPNR